MAIDPMAVAALPPPAAGPPGAAVPPGAATPPAAGGVVPQFSQVIAAAVSPGSAPVIAPASAPEGESATFNVDLAALIGLLTGTKTATGGAVPKATPPAPRPDRDAEAEAAAGALAVLALSSAVPGPAVRTVLTGDAPTAGAPVQHIDALAGSAGSPSASDSLAGGAVFRSPSPAASITGDASAPPTPPTVISATVLPTPSPGMAVAALPQLPRLEAPALPGSNDAGGEAPARPGIDVARFAQASASLATPAASGMPQNMAPAAEPTAAEPATERPVGRERPKQDSSASATLHFAEQLTSTAVPPHVGSPATPASVDASHGPTLVAALADTVQHAVLRGDHDVRIALNPPDLGHLTVHITEHASGTVTVEIHAASHEAHDLLQQQLPALRAGLEQRDVRVERLHVEQQASSAGLGWADGGQRQSSGRDAWSNPADQQWSPVASMTHQGAPTVTEQGAAPVEDGRVDLRA